MSAENLMKLGLPSKELLEQTRGKKGDKERRLGGKDEVRGLKDTDKPFKRQSYHVAIAYHIFLRNVKGGGSRPGANEIDPTLNARRLRDQNQRQP
jgi:hypothetical protein